MARRTRTGGKRGSGKKYKWCGGAIVRTVESFPNTAQNEIIVLCDTVGDDSYSDCVIERSIIMFHIHRALNTTLDGFAGVLAIQKNDQSIPAEPVQVLDALSLIPAEYSNRDILHWAPLPVPPTMSTGTTLNRETVPVVWDIKMRRKLHRSNEMLTLSMNTDITAVIRVFVQHRVLLSYGSK